MQTMIVKIVTVKIVIIIRKGRLDGRGVIQMAQYSRDASLGRDRRPSECFMFSPN